MWRKNAIKNNHSQQYCPHMVPFHPSTKIYIAHVTGACIKNEYSWDDALYWIIVYDKYIFDKSMQFLRLVC